MMLFLLLLLWPALSLAICEWAPDVNCINYLYDPNAKDPLCAPWESGRGCGAGWFLDQPNNRVCPCPNGYFCPESLRCALPCREGGYCPTGQGFSCAPYNTPQNPNTGECGGAPIEWKCPAGSFCPYPNAIEPCKKGHFCRSDHRMPSEVNVHCVCDRQGSSFPEPCPVLTLCPPDTGAPTLNFFLVTATFLILFAMLIIGCSFRRCCGRLLRSSDKKRELDRQEVAALNEYQKLEMGQSWSCAECGIVNGPDDHKCAVCDAAHAAVEPRQRFEVLGKRLYPIDIALRNVGLQLKESRKTILSSVSASFRHGRVTAIMGPSGCGKSSMLAVLTGKAASYGTISGDVLVNTLPGGLAEFQKRLPVSVGFVPQEDIMNVELTVKEVVLLGDDGPLNGCLIGAGVQCNVEVTCDAYGNVAVAPHKALNFGQKKTKKTAVRWVLHSLGLTHVAHERIGDEVTRGISGGQKKRVNIGMELVADPTLLLLDEPTSGLDSSTSTVIMQALKNLARLGSTVVVVLHQPRYEIFRMFDDVLLLGQGGRTVYMGPTDDVLGYFNQLGYELPPKVNPADFFMDVISGHTPNPASIPLVEAKEPVASLQGSANALELNSVVQEHDPVTRTDELSLAWEKKRLQYQHAPDAPPPGLPPERNLPGMLRQTWYCTIRALRQMWRSVSVELSDIGLVALAGVLVAFVFRAGSPADVLRTAFMVALATTIMFIQQSLRLFGAERVVFWREAASGLNRLSYFSGKTMASLLPLFIMPAVFMLFFHSFNAPLAPLSTYYLLLVMANLVCQGIGQILSIVMSPNKSQLAAVVVALLLCMPAGFSPTTKELEDMGFIGTLLNRITFVHYELEALVLAETEQFTPIFSREVQAVRQRYSFNSDDYRICLFIMLGMGLALRVLVLLATLCCNRKKQK